MNKIIFFGGKGGVGKTTCSASYALYQAKRGLKTLLVSTDPAHSTSDIFETKINDTISNLLPNLDAIEISGEKESKKYMDGVRASLKQIVSPIIVEQINKQIDAASISPGTEEAALFDKMIEIIIEKYDIICVDDGDAINMARKIASGLGIGVGISSGANLIGVLKAQNILNNPNAVIVTVFPDDNKKYLSTDLMKEQKIKPDYISKDVELLGFIAVK
jgi:hypothetical protein